MAEESRYYMTTILCVWLFFHHASAGNTSCRRSFTRHATYERYASPIQTEQDTSLTQCLTLCGQVQTCESVSYNQMTRQCEFNSAYPAQSFVPGISGPGWRVYYSSEYDLTAGAETWQSSTFCQGLNCAEASRAIDGNRNGEFTAGSCSIIQSLPAPPFWAVKLTSPSIVRRVSIYTRTDCCTLRLRNVIIMVAHTREAIATGGTKCADYAGPPSVRPVVITCTAPVYGQYVKIMRHDQDYLELCEVVINPYCRFVHGG